MAAGKQDWEGLENFRLDIYTDEGPRQDNRAGNRFLSKNVIEQLHIGGSSIPTKIATTQHGVFKGKIQDFSYAGAKIDIPKNLYEGQYTKVGFSINKRVIITKAIVRWVMETGQGSTIGVEFFEPNEDDILFLSNLLSEHRGQTRKNIDDLTLLLPQGETEFPVKVGLVEVIKDDDCYISNISPTGLQIFSTKALKPDNIMMVTFVVGERKITTQAVVRWVSREEFCWKLGLEFINMSRKDESYLKTITSE